MCQNLSPIGLLVYKLQLSETIVANFQNNGKIWFCVLINTVQAKQWFDKCYLDSAPSETTVKRWYADFKHGYTDTNDGERLGHPNLAVVLENTKKTPQTHFGWS